MLISFGSLIFLILHDIVLPFRQLLETVVLEFA